MTKQDILAYMRLRLDVIDSHVSPSYLDAELYPFLDKAQILITEDLFNQNKLELLKKIVESKEISNKHPHDITDGFMANKEGQFPVYTAMNEATLGTGKEFFKYILSYSLVQRPNDPMWGLSTNTWIKNDIVQPQEAPAYMTTFNNKPYFRNPKIFINNSISHLTIIPDYWTKFDSAKNYIYLTYLRMPKTITLLGDTEEPELHTSLHHEIANKAANLAKVPIDVQKAAAEVQVDDHIEKPKQ